MAQDKLLLIVRSDLSHALGVAWPNGVQVIVDRRKEERRMNKASRPAIQQRRTQRRQRRWADEGLDAQGMILVRA